MAPQGNRGRTLIPGGRRGRSTITRERITILDSARTDVNEAKAALARDRRPDPEVVAICLEAEGKLLQATGSPDSGVALLKRAVAIGERDAPSQQQLALTNSLAEVLRLSGRTRGAVPAGRIGDGRA